MSDAGARPANEAVWKAIFGDGNPELASLQRLHRWLPKPPRCKLCYAPFAGIGGVYMRLRGKGQNKRNPRYCGACDGFLRKFPGGAEVNMSMIFADVRGSVAMAERMSPFDVSRALGGFYAAATAALIATDGFVLELRGDCVFGAYPPGFSGPAHVRKAVEAAQRLLRNPPQRAPDGSPVAMGIGVHTGLVFIGTVGGAEDNIQDIAVHGDHANIAARLSQAAHPGEAVISDAALAAAGIDLGNAERRQVELQGRSAPIDARVLRIGP